MGISDTSASFLPDPGWNSEIPCECFEQQKVSGSKSIQIKGILFQQDQSARLLTIFMCLMNNLVDNRLL